MRSINLLPDYYKKEIAFARDNKNKRELFLSSIFIFVAILVLFGSGYYLISEKINKISKETNALQPQIDALLPIESKSKSLEIRLSSLKKIITDHQYWTNAYFEIGNLLPAKATVTSLLMDSSLGGEQKIIGTVPKLETLAVLKKSLEDSSIIEKVTLGGTTASEGGFTYDISFSLKKEAFAPKEKTRK